MTARIKYNVTSKCQIEIEAKSAKEAFKELAVLSEILTETQCGLCKSGAIKYDLRSFDGNDFYSVKCLDCAGRLDYGVHKVGESLFAKRDKGKNGWYIYEKDRQ